jgi:4-methylaminobutanoate oxidase (formaldehyde-forming)
MHALRHARAVVIGGGITGCSIAYHLALLGWQDVVLLEKGELTSGTTFHSVGLVTQFRVSATVMQLQNYSIRLYNQFREEVGESLGWRKVGSLRLASSPDQLKNLQRNISRAKGLGLNVELIGPNDAQKIFPAMTTANLYGAVHIHDDGYLEPNGITQELARRAKQLGVAIHTGVRVTGITLSPKREVKTVHTTDGDIHTEVVVNAAGQWARRIGEFVGITLPILPVMHQYIITKPVPGHELPQNTPVLRDPDNLVYMREELRGLLVGGFESQPQVWSPEGAPWEFTHQLLQPNWELFEELMQGAIRRVPLLADAEITNMVNGPDAMTPDGQYCLGPVPGLRGFYVAAGMCLNGIAGAGGTGKLMAEWIVEGEPSLDVHELNVRRFGAHLGDVALLSDRVREHVKYYYRLRYPYDENEWGRPFRVSPLMPRLQALGAVFGEKNGWERVNYFDMGKPSRRAGAEQRHWGWGRPPYFELIGEEHCAARERVALFDMTSFNKIDVRGPGAFALLQWLADNDLDKPIGSVTYTQFLNRKGGIESDLTITRLADNYFRVTTGTAFGAQDMGWIVMHAPNDGSVEVKDVTTEWACLGLWGPRARDVLQAVITDGSTPQTTLSPRSDVSNIGFPYMTAKHITIAGASVLALRVSYVGELGWEFYITPDNALKVWDVLMEAGKPHGIRPAGYKALESLRLEKGYRYWGVDITPADNPYESGQGFCVKLDKGNGLTSQNTLSPCDFQGRQALIEKRKKGLTQKLCVLMMAGDAVLYGGEAVYDGNHVVGRIRSGGYGYTIGKNIGFAYLPRELAKLGTPLHVEIFGEHVPAVVAPDPLYDPKGERMKV